MPPPAGPTVFMCKRIIVIKAILHEVWALERFQTAKELTFKVSQSLVFVSFDGLLVFHYNYKHISLSHTVSEI